MAQPTKDPSGVDMVFWVVQRGTIGVFLLLVIIGLISGNFLFAQIVPAGHTGVLLEFSAVKAGPLNEGLHFVWPFVNGVVLLDLRTQKDSAQVAAASSDLQTVTTTVALNYHISKAEAVKVYQTIGSAYKETVIAPAIEESVKAATAKFNAVELITKRDDVKALITDRLAARLKDYGLVVETISITDFQFSQQFSAAIESKMTAEQNALQAQKTLERVKFEAQQKIEQASGDATAKLTVATAEANAISLQGKALRENQEVVKLRYIEKWDGRLPNYMLGGTGNTIPILNIPNEPIVETNSTA